MNKELERKRSEEMRSDWERRIRSDYRFWMSDGVGSDEEMWRAGERDLCSLLGDALEQEVGTWSVLDLGCGVGRLMRAAAPRFAHVLGVDVSSTAVEKAEEFLKEAENTRVELIEGLSLSQIGDESLDAVYSFAVLGHVPTKVFVAYLLEINRVLRGGGRGFLQIYLGAEQETVVEDTLAVRSYEDARLKNTLELAGFKVSGLEELIMPFDARDIEKGIFPYILRIEKTKAASCRAEELEKSLLSQPEGEADESWPGSRLEYQMSITRVHQLIAEGKLAEAKDVLEFAVGRYKEAEEEAHKVLRELKKE